MIEGNTLSGDGCSPAIQGRVEDGQKRDKHSNEKIKLKTNDESELALQQAPTGNEVQDFAKGLYEGLKNHPDIWLSAALKFTRVVI